MYMRQGFWIGGKGRRFEWAVKEHLDNLGYFTIRSAGSKGPADIVAIKFGKILLIQCRVKGGLSPDDWNHLDDVAYQAGGIPILANRRWGGIRYLRLGRRRLKFSRNHHLVKFECLDH